MLLEIKLDKIEQMLDAHLQREQQRVAGQLDGIRREAKAAADKLMREFEAELTAAVVEMARLRGETVPTAIREIRRDVDDDGQVTIVIEGETSGDVVESETGLGLSHPINAVCEHDHPTAAGELECAAKAAAE